MAILKPAVSNTISKTSWVFLLSCGVYFLYPKIYRYFANHTKKLMEDRYVSGAKLITEQELNSEITRDGERINLQIGNVKIPASAEPKHSLVIGRPGAGKTTLLSQIIEKLKDKNNKGVIYDFKGDYLSKFYDKNRGDLIFNPLDRRSIKWNLFSEINTRMDIEAISNSLIPDSYQQDPFWNSAARAVFSDILYYLHTHNRDTNKDIWNMVSAEVKTIADSIQSTNGAGYTYIQDAGGKQAISVISTLMQYTSFFRYMSDDIEDTFSVMDWLNDGDRRGFIYITNYSDIQDTLRPILSLFVDLLGRKLLAMRDDFNRRLYFLIDEFGTLQRLTTIVKLLTLSRSKGGSTWLGVQDIGQIDRIYSQALRQAIINACGTGVIFGVSDPDTSDFLSRKIGDIHYSTVSESLTGGVEDNRDGFSISRMEKTKRLILGSDLSNLKDLECYLKLPNYHLCKTKLSYKNYEDRTEPFQLREGLSLEKIIQTQAVTTKKSEGVWGKVKEAIDKQEQEQSKEEEEQERGRDEELLY